MIGYLVGITPALASFRLRVAIPAAHMGVDYVIGDSGDVTFMYKLGNPELAAKLRGPLVFDVVNDHFERYPAVKAMALMAHTITTASASMAETVRRHTGRDAVVIDDPYENEEAPASVAGNRVGWFGHLVNLRSLTEHNLKGVHLEICTNLDAPDVTRWTPKNELATIHRSACVLLTGSNRGASCNRPVKAIRAGRFVVAPDDCPESWRQLKDYIWIGNVREGINWCLTNRDEACSKILAGQRFIQQRFSPQLIGSQWAGLFDSTLAAGTSTTRDGLALTAP